VVAMIWRKQFWRPICNFWKVARGISGIIFENPRVFLDFFGLWVDIEQEQGPFCKVAWNNRF
jgi:hypothetical protein